MSLEHTIDDEDYASSEDSDFAPDEAPDGGDASSDNDNDEDEAGGATAKPAATKRRRKAQAGDGAEAEDAGFENSGDEAIIGKGRKKQNKGRQAQREDEEVGEGGLIKTRSMRAVEKAERKTQLASGPVTVDVDALWASMTAEPVVPTKQKPLADPHGDDGCFSKAPRGSSPSDAQAAGGKEVEPSEMVKIKRTYNFAGKVHTEEKLVLRDSAEARLYLASQGENAEPAEPDQPDRRMPRKAFRSVFEPVVNTGDQGGRADLDLGIAMRLRARQDKAKKLNTVEKSRMDWAGFVDKEGIKDELALAGRAKGAFADRQDFLARAEARRDEEARRVRIASKM